MCIWFCVYFYQISFCSIFFSLRFSLSHTHTNCLFLSASRSASFPFFSSFASFFFLSTSFSSDFYIIILVAVKVIRHNEWCLCSAFQLLCYPHLAKLISKNEHMHTRAINTLRSHRTMWGNFERKKKKRNTKQRENKK